MSQNKNSIARQAGVLYLVTVITGIFSLMYVPKKIFLWDDAQKTIGLFQEFEFVFRLSIVSEILCYCAFLFLPMLLNKLLKDTNKNYSILMILLVMVAVPISLLAVTHKLNVLEIMDNTKLNALEVEKIHNQIGFYYSKIRIAQIFWGLWLFPFGYLVYISGLIPKLFGILLMLGAIGYVVNFIGFVLFSNYDDSIFPSVFKLPSSIGEIGTCLWLLIVGVKKNI